MTNEDQEKIAQVRAFARKTLENKVFQDIVGSGKIMANQAEYGSRAVATAKPAYDGAILSDEAREIRDRLYKEKREEGERRGIYARPTIDDYAVEKDIRDQVDENKLLLPLKDLAEIVRGIDSRLKAIPRELEAYVPAELARKIAIAQAKNPEAKQEEIFRVALNEEEQYAFGLYQRLSSAYDTINAYRISGQGALAEVNGFIDQVSEKYKKPEKEK